MIYKSNKLLKEEYLDSVQDPDNTGVDLKQVEDDIAGDDGIEAHSEEIEDAIDCAVSENGIIKNCACFVSENMILECYGNSELIKQQAILEGAKLNLLLKNFLNEGEDYKGLKKDLKEVINANNLSREDLSTGKKGFMHTCKRILQVLIDINVLLLPAKAGNTVLRSNVTTLINGVFQTVSIPLTTRIINAILNFVIGFIINRLLRFAVDTIEFNELKKDCESIINDLESMSKKAKKEGNDDLAKKYQNEADHLKESIKKYSNKKGIKNKLESNVFSNVEFV